LSGDDSLRRTANQAFFDKLYAYVTTDDQIDGQPGEPFNVLFNPDVQRLALRPKAEDESGTQTSSVVGLNDEHWVEVAGVEPASSRGEPDILRAQPTVSFYSAPTLVIGASWTGPALVKSRPPAKASGGQQAF